MSILFAASEIYPYAKSGGLADVAHSLPEAIRKKKKVFSIMPLYQTIDREKFGIEYSGITFEHWLNGVRHQFDIFHNKDQKDDLFVYNPILCDREGLYHDSYGDFGDNCLRFGLFSYAVLETMIRMELKISAIHINDWQTALVALLAKEKYKLSQKVILTIHNLAYQGIFPKKAMHDLEIDWETCFKPESLEYFDNVNYLKAGIYYSDYVTTVSPTYAHEIQTPLFGHTLENTLVVNNYKLRGILNGISYDVFDPQTDGAIYKNYSIKDYKFKHANKKALLKELGLEGEDKPLFIFIGRFTRQKGIDTLIEGMDLFKSLEANFIILGSGEEIYNNIFDNLRDTHPNIYIKVGYDEEFSRKLYASADFLLMPSFFEPCGLNQMIAMKYGTLPIVAKTGGLKDTVADFTDVSDFKYAEGIGITYEEHNMFWFLHAITKAISLFANKKKFEKISKHDMKMDYSWKKPAKEYLEIYKK